MFDKIRSKVIERNHRIAQRFYLEAYGPENEFVERRLMELGEGQFKIFDPGTDQQMFFRHRIFGPVIDEI